ncbi:sensor histidine kinase [Spiractinospora alimapuensis]|uniref:sensor histidine kinase n=1 Tax=Spiractinospora alimapuensis TaxID=2820884 RepID=UPI001F2986E8|nr:sensor histidine kinase [Spiractinospora alimapuensis]
MYEGVWEWFNIAVPWLLLLPTAAIVLAQRPSDTGEPTAILSLTSVAALWVLCGHTLAGYERRRNAGHALVYFVGLLAVSCLLMAQDSLFLMFTITAFFHAMPLRPRGLAFVGVGAASAAVHTTTMGFPGTSTDLPFLAHLFLYLGVITIQTFAIGAGHVAGERGVEQYRERQAMVAKLEAALEENAGLHAQLLTQVREAGVLDERQRMAREIHDTLAQGLTGIITQVQAAQRSAGNPDVADPHLDRALRLARESLNEARRSVQALRPARLETSHLPDALADLAREWEDGDGPTPAVEITGEPVALSPVIEVALFRVAQEALTNVAKHARATRVGVTLSYLDHVVLLDVRDDGTGRARDSDTGFGLSSMRQRVRGIGGTLQVESEPGEGTAVSAVVPAIPLAAAHPCPGADAAAETGTAVAEPSTGAPVAAPLPSELVAGR